MKKFFSQRPVVIGMVHFLPLSGHPDYPGFKPVLDAALSDAQALAEGGVDGIMLENNYDVPHHETVRSETVACFSALATEVRRKVSCPLGICVLWNDYSAALEIADACGAQFIRVPVFADDVRTAYGVIRAAGTTVAALREQLRRTHISILADVHVKHAELLVPRSIEESTGETVRLGADGVIVTGQWTADAPAIADLQRVRGVIGPAPLFVGSGATSTNVGELLSYANGVIVGTSLKAGESRDRSTEVNIKSSMQRIHSDRVREFVHAARENA